MISRLSIRSATLSIAITLAAGCSAGLCTNGQAASLFALPQHDVKTIAINNFRFEPDAITLHVGDTIEWKNIDIVPHSATAMDRKAFDSGPIEKGASWRFTFTKTGTFDYECTLHPNMKGKLVVE